MFLGSLEVDNKVFTTVEITAKPYHKKTTSIVCKIDTGAETNVIPKIELDKIIASASDKALGPPQILTAYGGQKIECMGTCQLFIHPQRRNKRSNLHSNQCTRTRHARM